MKTSFEGKKLDAVIIAFLFIITFFITFHIIRNHYQYVFKNVIAENTLTSNLLSSLLYEHQKAAISILASYAQRPLFIDAVKKKDFHRAFYHLKSLNENHTEIDALFITDQYGTLWANYPVDRTGFGKNLAHRDWYKGVSKKWRPYISSVYRLIVLEKGLAVALSVPVLDRKGKVIGILSGAHRTAFLATFIKANTLDPRKSITLLDQEGNIIFSNDVPDQEKITKYPDAHVLEKALAEVIIDMEIADAKEKGSISYVSIAPVRGIGWSVIVGQEKNAILKSLYRYFILSAATGSIIFLFLTVSLLYFRREYKYRKTKELLQSEEVLRESEIRYRELVENMGSGVSVYETRNNGEDFIFKEYNAAAEMLDKTPRGQAIGRSVVDVFPGVKDFGLFDVFQRVYRTGKSERHPVTFYKDEKISGWRENYVYKLPSGEIVAVFEDITDRKRAEEELQTNKAQLSNALEMAHLGHWEYDVANDLFTFNDHFYKIFRTTVEQVGGYTMHSAEYANRFVHPDDMDVVGEETRKAIETTDPHFNRQIEHRMLYADGTVGYITVRFFIVKDSHGRTVMTYGVNQDITERKQAEEEKRRLEERSRKVVEDIFRFIPEGVLVFSRKMELLRQNQAFRELVSGYAKRLGFAEDELENLIVDKIKAAMGDKNIKEIRISRKHETGEQI